jgi:hypothetical protein
MRGIPTAKLSDYADDALLTNKDLCKLLGFGPRYVERLVTLENKTGVRCTPEPSPNFGLGRKKRQRLYTKQAVARWMKSGGVPEVAIRMMEDAA